MKTRKQYPAPGESVQPRGWPAYLHPYRVTGHEVQEFGPTRLYPYDVDRGKVKSWVVIRHGNYLGIVARLTHNLFGAYVEGRTDTQYASKLHTAVSYL